MTANDISGRTICEILDDMRACAKTANYGHLPGLIEELQYRANRMEDRLNIVKDFESLASRRDSIRQGVKKANTVLTKEDRISIIGTWWGDEE